MRFIHTSDWHLGRTFHNENLNAYQQLFHEFLLEQVKLHQVDAVLIAGDVYDRSVPPVESVKLLSTVLEQLSEHCQVVLTPGNHDSAVRLGFGASLLKPGMFFRTALAEISQPVVLEDAHGEVLIFGIPFLEPETARTYYSTEEATVARSHEAVTTCAMEEIRAQIANYTAERGLEKAPRSIVLAHTFVSGGAKSDSERDLTVGGVDSVPGSVFNGVNYVALGHLHGKQNVTSHLGSDATAFPTQAWYSGSPLAFSFSEINHQKSVLLVDLAADGSCTVNPIPTPVPRRLAKLQGTLAELEAAAPEHGEDWVQISVVDGHQEPDLLAKLRHLFPHFLQVEVLRSRQEVSASAMQEVSRLASNREVVSQFYLQMMGSELDAGLLQILDEILLQLDPNFQEARAVAGISNPPVVAQQQRKVL